MVRRHRYEDEWVAKHVLDPEFDAPAEHEGHPLGASSTHLSTDQRQETNT